MLLALTPAQRCQTLKVLSIEKMKMTVEQCSFYITTFLKKPRPASQQNSDKSIRPNQQIFPLKALAEYLKRAKPLRGETVQLLISYQKPYEAVSTDTISRWLKEILTVGY